MSIILKFFHGDTTLTCYVDLINFSFFWVFPSHVFKGPELIENFRPTINKKRLFCRCENEFFLLQILFGWKILFIIFFLGFSFLKIDEHMKLNDLCRFLLFFCWAIRWDLGEKERGWRRRLLGGFL